jgi:hypothetical protein
LAFSAIAMTLSSTADAGDATLGRTLYVVTYACSDCHEANPTRFTVPPAPTVDALLSAIQSVPEMRSRYSSTLAQNPTDLADLAAYLASVAGIQTGPDLDQQALTGSWYEAAESGQGFEIEVFPDLIASGTGLLQGAWFTFDQAPAGGVDRQRWYTFNGQAQSGAADVPVTIFRNTGGNFDALPVTNGVAVGTGTMSFASCTSGSLDYTFTDGSGRSGSIPMTRLTPNVACVEGAAKAASADFGLSGNWFDPATSGQGFVFEVNPLSPIVFFAWYTYAPSGQAAGIAGQRWFTGLGTFTAGTHTAPLTVYETSGGVFDTPTPITQASVAVGTATVTFTSCSSAQLTFSFTSGGNAGHAGMIALSRVGPVPAGCAM